MALAATLSGCAWVGAGRDVAEALQKSSQVKTATLSGTVTYEISGLPNAPAGRKVQMLIEGSYDETAPAAPRSTLNMRLAGLIDLKVISPGDGNKYVVTDGRSYGAPIDKQLQATEAAGMTKVLEALGPAIGGFREGAAGATVDGEPLKTVFAEGDAGKICDQVWPQFAATMEASSGGESMTELTGGGSLASSCRKLLTTGPKFWFGIDATGMLRMLALEVEIAVPGTPAKMKVSIRMDIKPADRIPAIRRPNGVTMLGSQAELDAIQNSLAGN